MDYVANIFHETFHSVFVFLGGEGDACNGVCGPLPSSDVQLQILLLFCCYVTQKWMRRHGRRSTSSSGGAAAAATTPAAASALGARSSYHERTSSTSPHRRRRRLTQIRKEAWTDGERDQGVGGSGSTPRSPSSRRSPFAWSEESTHFALAAGGRGDDGGGSGSGRCGGDEEEEDEKKRRREEEEQLRRREKADRAFRAWLGRKKREAQADREAQRRKEETLEKLRCVCESALCVCRFSTRVLVGGLVCMQYAALGDSMLWPISQAGYSKNW